jgi:hypothetical protein
MLKFIRTTKTSTGLEVKAHFVRKNYKSGRKISDKQMDSLSIIRHETFPNLNYTITPRQKCDFIFDQALNSNEEKRKEMVL